MVSALRPSRRLLFIVLSACGLTLAAAQAQAQDKVLKVGTLKLIHGITVYYYEKFVPAGYKVEVIPFEYPYSTPIGPLNMILNASEKAIKDNPERIKLIVDMHRKAADYLMSHPQEMVDLAMQKLGQQRKSIEIAQPNVELVWKLDDQFVERAKAYSRLMFENKQIRQQPDVDKFVAKQFM